MLIEEAVCVLIRAHGRTQRFLGLSTAPLFVSLLLLFFFLNNLIHIFLVHYFLLNSPSYCE